MTMAELGTTEFHLQSYFLSCVKSLDGLFAKKGKGFSRVAVFDQPGLLPAYCLEMELKGELSTPHTSVKSGLIISRM